MFTVTTLVHGEEEAKKAQDAAKALFGGGAKADLPTAVLHDEDFTDGEIGVIQALVKAGLVTSNGEARRAITQGGVKVNGEKVVDVFAMLKKDDIASAETVLQRGKKNFKKLVVE